MRGASLCAEQIYARQIYAHGKFMRGVWQALFDSHAPFLSKTGHGEIK